MGGGNHSNRHGQKVVEKYNRSTDQNPQGACFRIAYKRVKEAGSVVGVVVPALDKTSPFGRLFGSHLWNVDAAGNPIVGDASDWLALPVEFRGKGAAGAMTYAGLGRLVESVDIWNGKLLPGAVIQTWASKKDYETVRDAKDRKAIDAVSGHSFVFLEYVRRRSAIIGMMIADQGYQSGAVLKKSAWGYWVGANLMAPLQQAAPSAKPLDPRVYGEWERRRESPPPR